jgi:serine/threonine-protein kinase
MKIVDQLVARNRVQKLRSARDMTPGGLEHLQEEILACGPAAIAPLLECLSHGEARPNAIALLTRLLSDGTLESYLAALASRNPTIASGVAQVLAGSHGYDPIRLLPVVSDARVRRGLLESVLMKHADRIPLEQVVFVLPTLARDSQVMLFHIVEKVAGPSNLEIIKPLLAHADPWIRLNAIKVLARQADETVVRSMIERLADESPPVRIEAIRALHGLKARDAVPDLVPMLRDPDFKIQSATIDALSEICDPSAVPRLLPLLTDDLEYARRGAVEVLNVVATPEAIQDLLRALRDEDWWVRVRAADALGTLGGEKVVKAVAGLLSDPDDFLRRHAVEILNAVPNRGAAGELIRALDDPDWWVRERAIDALGKSGDPAAVDPIVRLMQRDDALIPLCARALAMIGDARGLSPLLGVLDGLPEEQKSEVIEALHTFSERPLQSVERDRLRAALTRVHPSTPPITPSSPRGAQRLALGAAAARDPLPLRPNIPPPPTQPHGLGAAARGGVPPPSADNPAKGSTILNYADLPAGTVLMDRFRVLRKIGKGGFGAVYLVEDSAIEDQLILKILNPQLSLDETSARRFVQELKLTRRITHKNVIRIFDFLTFEGTHAVSMEYFPGTDLGRLVLDFRNIEPRRTLAIVLQVLDGLAAAHAEGVVHRDIKPANILINESDVVKVVDFGLASAQQQVGSRLTRSGLLIGTPEYMAPEQISGEAVDERADLYSVGILLYEMLSGTKPYMADSPVKILFQHLEGDAAPLVNLAPGIPQGLSDVVMRAMSRDPSRRPASARELHSLLESESSAIGIGS